MDLHVLVRRGKLVMDALSDNVAFVDCLARKDSART
jgi:hypothetical protein